MAARDQFQRFIFEHSQVRGAWVQLADSYQEIGSQAPYPDTVRTPRRSTGGEHPDEQHPEV